MRTRAKDSGRRRVFRASEIARIARLGDRDLVQFDVAYLLRFVAADVLHRKRYGLLNATIVAALRAAAMKYSRKRPAGRPSFADTSRIAQSATEQVIAGKDRKEAILNAYGSALPDQKTYKRIEVALGRELRRITKP